MVQVLVGLGSNLGDRLSHLQEALNTLASMAPQVEVVRVASLRETEPVGPAQRAFYNSAAILSTAYSAIDLLKLVKDVERDCGRSEPIVDWGPREIDIDILLYGNLCSQSAALVLPHDQLHLRRFVLEPCAEIAPLWVHPRLNRTLQDLLEAYEGDEPEGKLICQADEWFPIGKEV